MVASSSKQSRLRLVQDNEIPPLPEGWDVQRFRFLFRENKQRNGSKPVGDMLSVSEYRGVVAKTYEHEEQRRTDKELQTYRVVRPGQLAVNTMWLNHLGIGVSGLLGHVSPAYAVYDISPELDSRFVHHLFRSQYYLKIYLRYLYGIRPNSLQIKADDWNSIPVIVPPHDTQKAIADFLDRETASIDRLIRKKQRLVELLNSTHIAAPLRVMADGIGDIEYDADRNRVTFSNLAEGWQRVRVKQVAGHMTSGSRGWSDFIQDEGELFLQSGSIDRNMGVCLENSHRVSPQSGAEAKRTTVRNGDTLVCITGGRTGAVGYVSGLSERAYINQHVCLIRPSKAINDKLLAQILFSEIGQLHFQMAQYGLKQGMGFEQVANTAIPLPPREAQERISDEIDRLSSKILKVSEKINSSIDRLREFRSAVITTAVTGQIDVTNWSKRGQTDRRLDQIQDELTSASGDQEPMEASA